MRRKGGGWRGGGRGRPLSFKGTNLKLPTLLLLNPIGHVSHMAPLDAKEAGKCSFYSKQPCLITVERKEYGY